MSHQPKNTEPIPGYIVKERVGVGGYGEVWSAQAPGGLTKAIKFVYGYFDDERAARELKALNRIKEVRHPFLLSLERFEVVDGQLLIVTELAEMSLKDRFEQVKESGFIPRDELLGYLRDAADALDYLSEHFSLQHLDIKPENLLLVGGRVKVADFGLVKDLHEATASMMGGLTPVYAPPEVFDGRPCRHSDQYSLAIVYQEMLTGVLPFPGRTPAQLASQHLHARPRLTSLPAHDQPVIARALSKNPNERFANCRAFVDSLLTADQQAHGAPLSVERRLTGGVNGVGDTTSVKSQAAKTDTDWQRKTGQRGNAAPRPVPSVKTHVIGEEPQTAWDDQECDATVTQDLTPVEASVDTTPIDLCDAQVGLRPTLFLGIGGTATHALRQLRRRLRDRLGPASAVPAIQMLLLDTDAKNTYQATQGDSDTALAIGETLSLPLRKAHDYTSDSRDILQWLSRRWLYNIPRSLQTEGRRPLGRLALVDHSQRVLELLRKVLTEITSPESISASAAATGLEFRTHVPRVFIISSISGGTGGGMVLDVAYAVRKILADLGQSDDGVCGILTHSTDRNPSASELAIANTFACLSELEHYSGPNGYSGEPACGLPSFEGDQGTFHDAYLVHLGDNLSDPEFDQATDVLASYLYLNAVTPLGMVLDRCREQPPDAATSYGASTSLRSFGLVGVGGGQTSLASLATELVAKEVVQRWRGMAKDDDAQSQSASLIEMAIQRPTPGQAKREPAEQLAEEHSHELELTVERLCKQATTLLQNELGGDPATVCNKLRAQLGPRPHTKGGRAGQISQMLNGISSLFGPSTAEEDGKGPPTAPLRLTFERDAKELIAPTGNLIREWILGLTESPAARVGGAERARQWYAMHLRALEAQAADAIVPIQHDLQALVQVLHGAEQDVQGRSRRFGTRRAELPPAEIENALLRIVRLRYCELALIGCGKMLRSLASQVSAAGDQLKELQHALSRLSLEFSDKTPWKSIHAEGDPQNVFDEVKAKVARELRITVPEIVHRIDEKFQLLLVANHGGLRDACLKADAMHATIPTELRAVARAEVVAAIKQISIDEIILGSDQTAEGQAPRLQACFRDAAKPKLTGCAGLQRLLAILPEKSAGSALSSTIQELDPPATILNDADADLVLCHELRCMPLARVASHLIADRTDYARVAARLHTRMDVNWSELPGTRSRPRSELALK